MKIKFDKEHIPQIVVESGGYEGVRRIAGKVAEDFDRVAGFKPEVVTEREMSSAQIILCATLGRSPMLDPRVSEKPMEGRSGRSTGSKCCHLQRQRLPASGRSF